MRLTTAIAFAKSAGYVSQLLNMGAGTTWAGKTSLTIFPQAISSLSQQLTHRIVVVGTNGKTTTTAMIAHILSTTGMRVVHNATGANLRNGIAGCLVRYSLATGHMNADVGVFEVDEAELKHVIHELDPTIIVMLNLFRDQLDRYGELDAIAREWNNALSRISKKTKLVVNADDPLIAHIGEVSNRSVAYFGLSRGKKRHIADLTADSSYCISCGSKLTYEWISYAHLGKWSCGSCGRKRPHISAPHVTNPLAGTYNMYNTLAAFLTCSLAGISIPAVQEALESFTPVFGRQESLRVKGRTVQILLSKNPAGFNESMRTVIAHDRHPVVIIALNDRIVDGTDVSWIWDTDIESLVDSSLHIVCTGDRAWDMGVRVKYAAKSHVTIEPDLKKAVDIGLKKINDGQMLYILPTYSAMLDIRKILTGRKI